MKPFETERLRLRKFLAKDAEALYDYLSRPQVSCFADERLTTLAQAQEEVEKRSQDDYQFAVCLRETDQVIGHVFAGFEEPDTFCICWHFHPDFGGKGYATEAARAYLEYLFTEQAARRVYAYVEEANSSSQKLCERLGMRKEGTFLEFAIFVEDENGEKQYENTMQYALLRKEWLQS